MMVSSHAPKTLSAVCIISVGSCKMQWAWLDLTGSVVCTQIEVQEEDAARPRNFQVKIKYASSVAMRDLYDFAE